MRRVRSRGEAEYVCAEYVGRGEAEYVCAEYVLCRVRGRRVPSTMCGVPGVPGVEEGARRYGLMLLYSLSTQEGK